MRSGQLFTDPKFDYNLDSLGEKIEWARPQEICSEPKLVVEGTDQFDVIQVMMMMMIKMMMMMIMINLVTLLGLCVSSLCRGHANLLCIVPILAEEKLFTLLELCVPSLRRGHATLLWIVPILTDDPRRGSEK